MSLKEQINKLNSQIEEMKNENNKTQKSLFEDEIVIINKECTFNKNPLGSQFNSSIKKEIGLTENDIFKYHEIIQDLNNMILIYENFIFNKKVSILIIINLYNPI